MTTAPSLSVVLPVLNGERWLDQALNSIAAQSVAPHEVVVVEDGSTDRSRELAEARDFTRVISGRQTGIVASYQVGIDAAGSDAIITLGQDDHFADGAFAALVAALAENPEAGYVCGQIQMYTEETQAFDGLRTDRLDRPYLSRVPEAVAIRTDVLRRFPLNETVSPSWDVDLFLRMEDAGVPYEEIATLIAYKRLRPDSTTHSSMAAQQGLLESVRASVLRKREAAQ